MTLHSDVFRILGDPQPGGILVVADHASNRVPEGVDLGIAAALLDEHIAIDIGVAAVAERMLGPGVSAYLANVSRLVCDFNRDRSAPGVIPETSDGHVIPGNRLTEEEREARRARYFEVYHSALAELLVQAPPALIVSLHSFTPRLASDPAQQRPWEVGVLYNEDERAPRLAIPLLAAEGLTVGDQQPYSGKLLNATMNRHAEAHGRPYLGIEIRQDQIADAAGQAVWAERLSRIAATVAPRLG
jgi:predicted N-formylglutamate amidohydrolase